MMTEEQSQTILKLRAEVDGTTIVGCRNALENNNWDYEEAKEEVRFRPIITTMGRSEFPDNHAAFIIYGITAGTGLRGEIYISQKIEKSLSLGKLLLVDSILRQYHPWVYADSITFAIMRATKKHAKDLFDYAIFLNRCVEYLSNRYSTQELRELLKQLC